MRRVLILLICICYLAFDLCAQHSNSNPNSNYPGHYLDADQITAVGHVIGDKRVGKWVYYFKPDTANSKIYQRGEYLDDKKVGIWKTYNITGEIWTIQKWEKGKLFNWEYFDNKGIKRIEISTKDGFDTKLASEINSLGFYMPHKTITYDYNHTINSNVVCSITLGIIKQLINNDRLQANLSCWDIKGQLEQIRKCQDGYEITKEEYYYYYGKVIRKYLYENEYLRKEYSLFEGDTNNYKLTTYHRHDKIEPNKEILFKSDWTSYIRGSYNIWIAVSQLESSRETTIKESLENYRNGKIDGKCKYWNKANKLERIVTYSLGKKVKEIQK